MKALLQRWQARREAKALARRAIPDPLWQLTLARLPFLAQRSDADLAELRRLASLFLDLKEFTGADGLVAFELVDEVAVGRIARRHALERGHAAAVHAHQHRVAVGRVQPFNFVSSLKDYLHSILAQPCSRQ